MRPTRIFMHRQRRVERFTVSERIALRPSTHFVRSGHSTRIYNAWTEMNRTVYHERVLSVNEGRVEWWRCRELNPGLGGLTAYSTCVAVLFFGNEH